MENFMVEFAIPLAYGLIGLALLGAVILPLIKIASDVGAEGTPAIMRLLPSLIAFVAIILLYFVFSGMASNEVTPLYERFGVDAGLSQNIGGVLMTMYFLVVVGMVLMVVGGVLGIVKKFI